MAIEVIIGGVAIGGGSGGGVGGPANTAVTSATAQTTALGLTEIQLASVTITPTSVDSKILLIGRLDVTKDAGVTVRTTTARIRRGTTNGDTQIGVDSKALSSAVATTTYGPGVIAYVDAPATAVATTYTLRALCDAASGSTANRWELNAIEVASKGADGVGGGTVTISGTPTAGQITEWTDADTIQGVASTGTGTPVRATSPTLVTPALGTPSSGNLSNCSNIPLSGLTGLGTGVATFLATPSSANLASAVTGETGTGALVFATSPTLVTPLIGTPTSGVLTNCTGLPLTTGVTGTLQVGNGGTGLNTLGTAGQILKVNAGGTALEYAADATGGGGVSDGDKGDITISGTGATYTIDAGVVTLAKMANLAQDQFIVRTTASTGVPQTATITAYGRSLVAAVDLAAARTVLGLTTSTPGAAGDMLVYNGTITQYQTKAQVRANLAVTDKVVIPYVATPADGTVTWVIRLAGTGTINSLTHKGSGITLAVKLNTTTITGLSAVAPTGTKTTTNATAANVWADGDELNITFSGASSPGELAMCLNATRLT